MSRRELRGNPKSFKEGEKGRAISVINDVLQIMTMVQHMVNKTDDTMLYQYTEDAFNITSALVSQTDQGILNLEDVQNMTKSIETLSEAVIRFKAENPLISQELVNLIAHGIIESRMAVKLTKIWLE